MEQLIEHISSKNLNQAKEAKDRFNAILDSDLSKIANLKKYTKNQNKLWYFLGG